MDAMTQNSRALDRALIGRLVWAQIPRNPDIRTPHGLAQAARMSRSTLYDVRDGNPRVQQSTFARIEAALDLPIDTLKTVGKHDLDGLREIGAPESLVRWVGKEIVKVEDSGEGTVRTAT